MSHVMLDLETLGTTPNSVILSIGAVNFSSTFEISSNDFFAKIDVGSALLAGLDADKNTLNWWRSQSIEAQDKSFDHNDRWPLSRALLEFADYFKFFGGKFIWGNGSDFDVALLKRAYNLCGLDTPWIYKNVRCFRTINNLFGTEKDRMGPSIPHDPVSDAVAQTQTLNNIYTRLNLAL